MQYDEVPPPIPPYLVDNDQPPPIPLFYGGDEPPILSYNEPVTAQYFEVKQEHTVPHVTVAREDYSVLKRDNVSHVPFHNISAGGDYSVLKREEREVS